MLARNFPRRGWAPVLVLVLHAARCGVEAVVTDCISTPAGAVQDGAITEKVCLPPRANLNPDVRYFKITVGAAGADMVYTSLISPNNSTCTGTQGNHICSAPLDNIVTYKTFSGQKCVPDEKNNNWADLNARFSKAITVCKPCVPGDYWVGLRHHTPQMACDLKLFVPKLSSSDTAASCSFEAMPANSIIENTPTCADGFVRVKEGVSPFVHTCLLNNCWNMCLLGYCQDFFFLGAAALVGLLVCSLFSCCILCICRRSWSRKLKLAEDSMRDMASKPYNVTVADDDMADSDKEDEVPDMLPATFFVHDRDD